MKTHSGILIYGKKEEKAIRTLLEHARRDIHYGWDGSYGGETDKNGDDVIDEKSVKLAEEGIRLIEWILETYKK